MFRRRVMILTALFWISAGTNSVGAFAQVSPYSAEVLTKDMPRLSRAIRNIYTKGLAPFLTASERRATGHFQFAFPMPRHGDDPLNVYASYGQGKAFLVMPVQSLKMLEDLTTAYAWLYANKKDFGAIDLFFAIRRYQGLRAFKDGRLPPILKALGIPDNALSDKTVDKLSLSFRNEAFAFLMAHELGHIRFRHKGYDKISKVRARADEVEADRFALDLLGRTGTPPLGAMLFFQAMIYSDRHRGEFKTVKAWEDYLLTTSTHPLTVDRLQDFADYIAGPLAKSRKDEAAIWRSIASKLRRMIVIMQDVHLQRCIAALAARAKVSMLLQHDHDKRSPAQRHCKGS